ncbi:MAG: hypothetical protein Ct9H300mP22_2060 [Gammaproteobacteria bacterium]|nr:MAG: hypothetical protein Ct9H300mP22_2060 [Gammaproteobacteria bacterium]
MLLQWINPRKLFKFGHDLNEQRKAKARSDTIEGLLYFTRGIGYLAKLVNQEHW